MRVRGTRVAEGFMGNGDEDKEKCVKPFCCHRQASNQAGLEFKLLSL